MENYPSDSKRNISPLGTNVAMAIPNDDKKYFPIIHSNLKNLKVERQQGKFPQHSKEHPNIPMGWVCFHCFGALLPTQGEVVEEINWKSNIQKR